MNNQDEINDIISTNQINGGPYWSRYDGDIHAPNGFSTIDVLNTLGEIGARHDDNVVIGNAIGFIMENYYDNGCFRYAPKSSKLPCLSARILTAFCRLGHIDDRLEQCYQHFLKTQRSDGGWRCATAKLGKSPEMDASNPGTTLYVLDAFRYRNNSAIENEQLEKAALFLLSHWETKKPLGPCQFGIGSKFMMIEYPFLRYNLFYYVYILSKYPMVKSDARYNESLQLLLQKLKNGMITPETPHKAWQKYSFARTGEISELASQRVSEIIS